MYDIVLLHHCPNVMAMQLIRIDCEEYHIALPLIAEDGRMFCITGNIGHDVISKFSASYYRCNKSVLADYNLAVWYIWDFNEKTG